MQWLTRDPGRLLAAVFVPAALVAGLLAPGAGAEKADLPGPLPNPDRPAVTPVARGLDLRTPRSERRACRKMRKEAKQGNSSRSLAVVELDTGRSVCSLGRSRVRALASNTKLLTTAALLGRLGPDHRFRTRLFADGEIDEEGTLDGDLYLKGGGDPGLGVDPFLRRYLGGAGTRIDPLVAQARKAGLRKVTGRIYGDETIFDSLRGVADSGYATSLWIGPLSGLSINAGFTGAGLSTFSPNPARLATKTLVRRLRDKRVAVMKPRVGLRKTPRAATRTRPLAEVESEDMAWMARVTNVNSNNFFAEMLVKALGANKGRGGSTSAGTQVVRRFAASLGARTVPVDGSGLTRANRASSRAIADLLIGARREDWWPQFRNSLPIAGREGTVAYRMRGTAAEGRCRAKTGTLTGVSTLSGYCFNRSDRSFVFSILMNGVSSSTSARAAQDRIAALVAGL